MTSSANWSPMNWLIRAEGLRYGCRVRAEVVGESIGDAIVRLCAGYPDLQEFKVVEKWPTFSAVTPRGAVKVRFG